MTKQHETSDSSRRTPHYLLVLQDQRESLERKRKIEEQDDEGRLAKCRPRDDRVNDRRELYNTHIFSLICAWNSGMLIPIKSSRTVSRGMRNPLQRVSSERDIDVNRSALTTNLRCCNRSRIMNMLHLDQVNNWGRSPQSRYPEVDILANNGHRMI